MLCSQSRIETEQFPNSWKMVLHLFSILHSYFDLLTGGLVHGALSCQRGSPQSNPHVPNYISAFSLLLLWKEGLCDSLHSFIHLFAMLQPLLIYVTALKLRLVFGSSIIHESFCELHNIIFW